ncbi:MAG: hypothetical protein H7X93_06040 [Sphingomonadaceae bacterium]|nr:hypothetical protein [Sphingomonadaceae bacterium]
MTRPEVEAILQALVQKYGGRAARGDEAIYQDVGLNGYDFYKFMEDATKMLALPDFDWGEFADLDEPPGSFLLGRLLSRRRLTIDHLVYVTLCGRWSDPVE